MTISRLDIDYSKKELTITADAGDGHTIAAIKIDNCRTFNCVEEASTSATTVYTGTEQVLTDKSIDISDVELRGVELDKGLFFVYFYVNDPEAGFYTMKVFYNSAHLAKYVFDNIKRELLPCDRCAGISENVIDNVMLYFGVKEAVEQKEYRYACEFLQAIYRTNVINSSNCGCHGR